MNIIFITKLLPYPIDTGGKIGTFKIFEILARSNDIHLVSYVDRRNDLQYEKILKTYCRSVKTFYAPIINQNHKSLYYTYLLSLFSVLPFTVKKFYSREMAEYVNNLTGTEKIDMIFIDHFHMGLYVPESYSGKCVCNEHDISYIAFNRYAEDEGNIIKKAIYKFESIKLKKYESELADKMDYIFTVSEKDRLSLIDGGADMNKISFLPIPFSCRNLYSYRRQKLITFVGLLTWLPNVKGLEWFIKKIFPLILRADPEIRFQIIGEGGDWLKSIVKNNKRIKYLGYVSDLTDVYKQTSVFVVPIKIGSGIRIKLAEALSYGLPVVSTSLGAEGIDVKNEHELLIADDERLFAKTTVEVIKNQQLSERLSKNGLRFIRTHYNIRKSDEVLKILNSIK